jgi:uncharacterized protein (DUF1697 family)
MPGESLRQWSMSVVIALLRAVNVGGRNTLNMEELRTICAALGHKNIQTYLQSGNVVFRTENPNPSQVAKELEAALLESLGVETVVIPRTPADLRATVAANPFAEGIAAGTHDPSKLIVAYFQSRPSEEVQARAAKRSLELRERPNRDIDELRFVGREAYIYYPNGVGKATFNWSAFERASKIPATARNWTSTLKILEMAEATPA